MRISIELIVKTTGKPPRIEEIMTVLENGLGRFVRKQFEYINLEVVYAPEIHIDPD